MLITLGIALFVLLSLALAILATSQAAHHESAPVRRAAHLVGAVVSRTQRAAEGLTIEEDEERAAMGVMGERTASYALFGVGLLGAMGFFVLGLLLLLG
jgi:hypothetical protein